MEFDLIHFAIHPSPFGPINYSVMIISLSIIFVGRLLFINTKHCYSLIQNNLLRTFCLSEVYYFSLFQRFQSKICTILKNIYFAPYEVAYLLFVGYLCIFIKIHTHRHIHIYIYIIFFNADNIQYS